MTGEVVGDRFALRRIGFGRATLRGADAREDLATGSGSVHERPREVACDTVGLYRPPLSPRTFGRTADGYCDASSSTGCAMPNTCRRYARYALSSHMLLPGESDSFATGWPLQRTILMTICSGT